MRTAENNLKTSNINASSDVLTVILLKFHVFWNVKFYRWKSKF